jgi:hypothetical protein
MAVLRSDLYEMLGRKKKDRLGRRSSGFLCRTLFCYCVNLPLLHRRWAGMAKPKIKGKENGVAHVGS